MTAYLTFLRENAPWLGAGLALAVLSTFGQTAFIAVFAGDVLRRYDLSDGGWGAIYAGGTTASAIVMVWAGALADRVALSRLAGWTLAGLALSCAGMALAPGVWLLPILVLGLRLFGQGMLSHLAFVAMARWFVAMRGRAVAIAAFGFALGQAVLPLAAAWALHRMPAAWLWTMYAVVALISIWPVTRLLARPRHPQGAADATMQVPGREGRHWRREEMLRDPLFWSLLPALLGPPAFGTAFFFFQVHLPEVKCWSQVAFVALFPVILTVSTVTSFASGALIDRAGASRLLPWAILPMAAGFVGLAWAPTLAAAVPAVTLLAVTMGAMTTVPVSLWAEQFGTRHLGAIKAASTAVMVLGTALGPGLVGALIDRGLPFPAQMPWIAVFFVLSSGLAHLGLRRAGIPRPAS